MSEINVGILETLLQNPDVLEIDINAPDSIYYWDKWEGRKRFEQSFDSEASVRTLAEQLATAENMTLDYKNPIVEARLADATRLLLMIPPVTPRGTVIRIMKAHPYDMTLERLVEVNAISQDMADFMRVIVENRANVAVVGSHRSGKTTLLHVLYQQIPESARVVSIQPMSTFNLTHMDSVMLETRKPDLNGEGAISAQQLMTHVEILNPDRLIVVQLEGAEFPQLLDQFSIGRRGMFAMEASSLHDSLARMEVFATSANLSRPLLAVREQITQAVDFIIHIDMAEMGLRRVYNISEVVGMQGDSIALETVFTYGEDADKNMPTGYVPQMIQKLNASSDEPVLSEAIFTVE